MPPLRGWILVVFVPPFSQKSGSHALSKARMEEERSIAALKALRHPKANFSANWKGPPIQAIAQ
jgi:hypothetical protein